MVNTTKREKCWKKLTYKKSYNIYSGGDSHSGIYLLFCAQNNQHMWTDSMV